MLADSAGVLVWTFIKGLARHRRFGKFWFFRNNKDIIKKILDMKWQCSIVYLKCVTKNNMI